MRYVCVNVCYLCTYFSRLGLPFNGPSIMCSINIEYLLRAGRPERRKTYSNVSGMVLAHKECRKRIVEVACAGHCDKMLQELLT